MNRKMLAIILLIPLLLVTVYALVQTGLAGVLAYPINEPWSLQVALDLVVALVLVFSWLIPDAKAAGRNPWPWAVATLFLGSISPLFYLAVSPDQQATD